MRVEKMAIHNFLEELSNNSRNEDEKCEYNSWIEDALDANTDFVTYFLSEIKERVSDILKELGFYQESNCLYYPEPESDEGKMVDALFSLIYKVYDEDIVIEGKNCSTLIWRYLLDLEGDGDVDYSGSWPLYVWEIVKEYHKNKK